MLVLVRGWDERPGYGRIVIESFVVQVAEADVLRLNGTCASPIEALVIERELVDAETAFALEWTAEALIHTWSATDMLQLSGYTRGQAA